MRISKWARLSVLGVAVCVLSALGAASASAEAAERPGFAGSADTAFRTATTNEPEPAATSGWAGFSVLVSPGTSATPTPVPTPIPTSAPAAAPLVLPESEPESEPELTPVPAPAEVVRGPIHVERGQAALNTIGYDLSSIGYSISFHPGSLSYRGLTFTQRRHIEIYVRPSMSDAELTYVIAHEMGHAVDHIRNSDADRVAWRNARGISSVTAWWPTGVGTDYATPAGDFAECFATWAAGSGSHSAWGGCGSVTGLMAELASR